MAGLAAVSLAWAISSTLVSTLRFWRSISQDIAAGALAPALWRTLADIVTLRHLDGGGPGCHDSNEDFSQKRRFFHQIMAGGVLAAFAATLAAAFWEHAFGLKPPFALASAPVLLGIAGGVAIVAGAGGLLAIEARADRDPSERGETQMNVIFLIALELVTLSGLALLVWRETAAMGPLLAVHLALVTGFFAGLPASKAFHAPFRAAALLRNALDGKRAPRRKAASPE
jgi:citrate/tricarballylate utilization protein